MSTPGADIDIALLLDDGRVADVGIVPRRLPALGKLLAGREVAQMLVLLPRLFALCSTAHRVAAQTAVGGGPRGAPPPPPPPPPQRRALGAGLWVKLRGGGEAGGG
ncbi:hypothetical protein P3G22_04465, partial [Rhodopseudomonas sp. BAL398]|nr:hypothetical protein [Rhodopseudomonas sp. BAL398]